MQTNIAPDPAVCSSAGRAAVAKKSRRVSSIGDTPVGGGHPCRLRRGRPSGRPTGGEYITGKMKFLPRFARQLRIDALERRLRREAARAAALPVTLFRLMTRGLDAAGGEVARRGPVAWMHSLSGRRRGV